MSCYGNTNADGSVKGTGSVEIDNKWSTRNRQIPSQLLFYCKRYGDEYNLDWKWLAAIAFVESSWGVNRNIFAFMKRSYVQLEAGEDFYDVKPQTRQTAKNMRVNFDNGKTLGIVGEEECYLYAGMCHNQGPHGAQVILDFCAEKTVSAMQQAIYVIPQEKLPKELRGNAKKVEIQDYPSKLKTAYMDISRKYS